MCSGYRLLQSVEMIIYVPLSSLLLTTMYPVIVHCFSSDSSLRARSTTWNTHYAGKYETNFPLHSSHFPEGESKAQTSCESGNERSIFRSLEIPQVSQVPLKSIVLLNLVAVIWGTQHAAIKMVVGASETPWENIEGSGEVLVAAFTLARFSLGSLFSLPLSSYPSTDHKISSNSNTTIQDNSTFPQLFEKSLNNSNNVMATWRWGAELGIWMFLGYALQAIGLQYTTASKSGFLLYLNVKFVPFFARFFFGRTITILTWTSAALALLGTGLLAFGDSLSDASTSFNIGDFYSICAAMSSAMFILRLEAAVTQVESSLALSSGSLWAVTFFSFVWTLSSSYAFAGDKASLSQVFSISFDAFIYVLKAHPFSLLYLGGVTTALANYLQTIGQRGITAERASLFYAMDPVYGAFFAYFLLGEQLGSLACVGAILITFAAVANAFIEVAVSKSK